MYLRFFFPIKAFSYTRFLLSRAHKCTCNVITISIEFYSNDGGYMISRDNGKMEIIIVKLKL